MKKLIILVIFLMAAAPFFTSAAEIKFKGLVQTWFSYAEQEAEDAGGMGFTLRRVRFKPYGSLAKNIEWGIQVFWDKQTAGIYDAYLNFKLSKGFNVKVGQFAAPGTVSGALTSSGALDLIERASIVQNWNGNSGLSGYRAMGVQAHGNLMDGKLYYALMLANPKTTGIFTPGVKSPTYESEHDGIMVWARLEAKPMEGLRIGAFYGGGKEENTDYVRNSYGGHIFYVKDAINFKVEYMAGEYGVEDGETEYNGMYALFGYRFDKVEPIVRYGFYTPSDGSCDGLGVERYNNIALGLNYYLNKNVKLQANYVVREETVAEGFDKLKNNLFYVNCQYSY